MYNWSTDEKMLKGQGEYYTIWHLQQMVNFGLRGERIPETILRKYWQDIDIDPARKKFLTLLLDGNRDSHE